MGLESSFAQADFRLALAEKCPVTRPSSSACESKAPAPAAV
jgi:hypothetical protein